MKFFLKVTVIFFLCTHTLFATTNCVKNRDPAVLVHAAEQAMLLKKTLDQLNPSVALISRVGSDISKYGLYYSHAGFVVKDYPGRPGQWTVIQLLNECGTSHSSIYAQGLINFFMDGLYNMDFQVITLTVPTQRSVVTILNSPWMLALHNPSYNKVAYPFSTMFQNSNQWVLEVIVSATTQAKTREEIQQILAKTQFKPSIIRTSTLTKIGAELFIKNIHVVDHPDQERSSNQFSIVSVDAVIDYLKKRGMLSGITENKKGR